MKPVFMRRSVRTSLIVAILFFPLERAWTQQPEHGLVQRGDYIFSVAGGCACHTVPDETAHAGGREFPIPFGKVYSTNITADKETGLGGWSDQEIYDALAKGVRRDGKRILAVMPSHAYSGMAQEDLKALVAYLRTIKPVGQETPRLKTWIPFYRPLGSFLWLKLYGGFSSSPARAPASGVERGRYLVEHVSICGDCHTPRNFLGVPNRKLYLAGAMVLGEEVPNITPDKETGIGEWGREDIAHLLLTGTKPDLDNVQGLMAEVIEGGYEKMTKEDALAIADYLLSVPPIKNKVR